MALGIIHSLKRWINHRTISFWIKFFYTHLSIIYIIYVVFINTVAFHQNKPFFFFFGRRKIHSNKEITLFSHRLLECFSPDCKQGVLSSKSVQFNLRIGEAMSPAERQAVIIIELSFNSVAVSVSSRFIWGFHVFVYTGAPLPPEHP